MTPAAAHPPPPDGPGTPTLTRTQWAHDTLKRMIMDNELQAGSTHLEQALAERLGVSRTPLREAAQQLEQAGFVTIRPRLGITVRPISARDMKEIYDLLTQLEPYAAATLAANPPEPERLAPLTEAVAEMDAALDAADRDAWARADRAFHGHLIALAGNRRLLHIVSGLWDQVHRARMATLALRSDLASSNKDHRKLVALIRAGDVKGAERLHRKHRARAGKALTALLARSGVDEL